MSQIANEWYERLGVPGLTRVLDDLLDRNRLIRLANTVGLKYPGMRMRSQTRQKILEDLVTDAGQKESTRKSIFHLLRKETRPEVRKWTALSAEEKAERLGDSAFLQARGNLGLHLFFLACAESESEGAGSFETLLARQHLLRIASNGKPSKQAPESPPREVTRLKKRESELKKKLQHLENQLLKVRETEKNAKRDLIKRKGELAESRMTIDRLDKSLTRAKSALQRAAAAAKAQVKPEEEQNESLVKSVRKLASEQRKLTHRLETLAAPAADGLRLQEEALSPVLTSLKQFHKELGSLRKGTRDELAEQARRIEELRAAVTERKSASKARRAKRSSSKPADQRVGVFIDVQNMYYGARQLKGKLDFDALIDAAVSGRRLVQPTAYVVESKEIDQSEFIARLQQRAIEVRRKTVRVRADGSRKGDWDMELALDILDAAPRLDVVVLVSGDGDFTSLVKRVKQMGPRVEVIAFPRNTAKSLLEAADRFQPLDRKFMIYSRKAPAKAEGATKPAPK